MSEKENKNNTVSDKTALYYCSRVRQLVSRWRRESEPGAADIDCHPAHFVRWLISLKSTLAANSWHQYRSATLYVLREQPAREWPFATEYEIEEASKTLTSETQAGCVRRTNKTSAKKAKSVSETDMAKLLNYLAAEDTKRAASLLIYFIVAPLTGLRPCEWPNFSLCVDPSTRSAQLVVKNAKFNAQRAHGTHRTLFFTNMEEATFNALVGWMRHVEKITIGAENPSEAWSDEQASMGDALYYRVRKIWPRRKQHITLYTTRHMATASFKMHLKSTEVAALLGHATTESASRHYARASTKSCSNPLKALPKPQQSEAAKVRDTGWRGKLKRKVIGADVALAIGKHRSEK